MIAVSGLRSRKSMTRSGNMGFLIRRMESEAGMTGLLLAREKISTIHGSLSISSTP